LGKTQTLLVSTQMVNVTINTILQKGGGHLNYI